MFLRATFSMFFSLFVFAGATTASAAVDPETFIQDVARKAFVTIAAANLSDSERNDRFRQTFLSAFNIPEMGKSVLSRHWAKSTPAQQKAFLKEFEDIQVLTWGRRFKEYGGLSLETLGEYADGDAGWMVESRIIQSRGPPISVRWRLHADNEGLPRITDIIVEGISMILTCRDDYGATLRQSGGDIDALLAAMRAKNRQGL